MKINSLLETTAASDPANATNSAPHFGRSDKFLEEKDKEETVEESSAGGTSSGSIATVAGSTGGMQRRGQGSMFAGIKTSSKYPNSKAVKEGKNSELDSLYDQYDELDYDGNSESDKEKMRHIQQKIKDLKALPGLIEKTLLHDNDIQAISSTFNDAKGSMFLGRGFSYPIALEGALKLKELSYVHAEGYPAGEMKHGPLALIEEGMPVVVLAPRDNYYKKTISNMQEVIARGAKVLLITNKSKDEVVSENIWETIEVENTNDDLLPFLLTIPLQKLAYYSALKKGFDIDKPRNLAKSVTVE